MKELKFLKDLPIKITNSTKGIVSVVGGDIYYDAEGNKYAYITFRNNLKTPVLALQLDVKEYSIDGKFIKNSEFFLPNVYYPRGDFIIDEPIIIDKETEGIEVYIIKATLTTKNFVNDRIVGFTKADYVDLFPRKAPIKKRGTAGLFTFDTSTQPGPASQVQEEPVQPKVESSKYDGPSILVSDNSEFLKNNNSESSAPEVALEAAPEAAPEVTPTADAEKIFSHEEETPIKEEEPAPAPAEASGPRGRARPANAVIPFVPAIVAMVVLVILTFIIIGAVTGGVNQINNEYINGYYSFWDILRYGLRK